MSDDRKIPGDERSADTHPLARRMAWTDSKIARDVIGVALGVFTAILLILDWVIDRHPYGDMEQYKGVYVAFGFIGFSFVVLSGWVLRILLSRPQDYYTGKSRSDDHG